VRARGLCAAIAGATQSDRVSYLTTSSAALLVATSTSTAPNPRTRETLRLERFAMQARNATDSPPENDSHDDHSIGLPECLESFAIPIRTGENYECVAVIVLQRFAVAPARLNESLAPGRPQIESAASLVAESLRRSGHDREQRYHRRLFQSWRRATRRQRTITYAFMTVTVIAIVASLARFPVAFRFNVYGRIETIEAHAVDAPVAGMLTRLHVIDGQLVSTGD